MTEAGLTAQEPTEPTEPSETTEPATASGQGRPARRRSMFADPVVRALAYASLVLVLVFLSLVMGALLFGVFADTGPRTLVENELAVASQAVNSGRADASTWGKYIAALVANERYSQAASVIKQGRASIDDSATAEFSLAEARLLVAREDYQQAIGIADKGQKQIKTVHQKKLDAGGQTRLTAINDGIHENWFILALLKAEAFRSLGEWEKVVKELDSYIAENPQAADILVERGYAKIETGDTKGAEADFRKALKFIPDDEAALKGLDEIGASDK